ncbi:hypothetical protein JCM11491_000193 [Sporobolomyces phaffii]
MHPPSPPHSSPEDSTRSVPKFRSHAALSPEQGRPDIKRPRSSLANPSARTSSAAVHPDPYFQHRPDRILPPPACSLAQFPTPALTPESTFPATSTSTSSHDESEEEATAASRGFIRRDDLIQRAVDKVASERKKLKQNELLQAEKDKFVNGLVGASVLAIESIWGPSSSSPASTSTSTTHFTTSSTVLPLHYFVREVLRRSRTSCSTLQLALYYLHKSRKTIRDAVAAAQASRNEIQMLARGERERIESEEVAKMEGDCMGTAYFAGQDAYPSPPESPCSTTGIDEEDGNDDQVDSRRSTAAPSSESLTDRLTRLLELQKSPLLCGRRMFLASLISASKYLQDRNYSNKAWCKISGLEIKEINLNERAFLELVGWELHLKAEDFKRWTERLNTLTTPTVPSASDRQGLARTASEYLPSPPTSSSTPQHVRPTTSNLLRSKLALHRGTSVPHLESSSSATARSCGFPIAQPISSSRMSFKQARPVQTVTLNGERHGKEELETTEEEDNVVAVPVARPVRALPIRRARLAAANSGVPSTWSAGISVRGGHAAGDLGGDAVCRELVSVH